VAEDKDVPARVTLMEIPTRNEVRVKNLFNVADCKMHWQKSGDFLCVKVDRYSKLRKEKDQTEDGPKYAGMYFNFEVFHMREKQIPVDSVEIKEPVHAFSWEPVGTKFAIIHGESQSLNVSFYGIKTGQTPSLLKKYERKTANHIFWSPAGQFVILAGLKQMSGVLEFIDTSDFTVMNSGEHFMATDVEWDPTGRYLMTGVSWWGQKVDNAYWIWNFQGKILRRAVVDKFCHFLWRPRPQTLLTKKHIKELKKNLKKYSEEFDAKDIMRMSKASQELMDKRKNNYDEFMAYRGKRAADLAEQREQRMALRDDQDTDGIQTAAAADDSEDMDEEVVEFLVKEEESIID
jgi:translation initiation factor 3 subunit B